MPQIHAIFCIGKTKHNRTWKIILKTFLRSSSYLTSNMGQCVEFSKTPMCPEEKCHIHIIGKSWEVLNLLTIVFSSTAGALVVISVSKGYHYPLHSTPPHSGYSRFSDLRRGVQSPKTKSDIRSPKCA